MAERIIVVDDEQRILEAKVKALRNAGFEVESFRYPTDALVEIADRLREDNPPYALITDNDIPTFLGCILITYLSPKTNRQDSLIASGSREATRVAYRSIDGPKIRGVEGQYQGKTILTSRQELKPQTIDNSLPDKGKRQLAALNEALRISDGVFKIGSDGTGLDNLIEYLRR